MSKSFSVPPQPASSPAGWPSGVQYILKPQWSALVAAHVKADYVPAAGKEQSAIWVGQNVNVILSPAEHDWRQARRRVRIRKIENTSHPCFGAQGLFAAQSLSGKSYICDYIGLVLPDDAYSRTSDYVLRFGPNLSIDAEKMGNEGRFVNDFRGCAERPNVCFLNYMDERTREVRVGVFVIGKEKIKKGEELLVSYGKSFWKSRGLLLS